MGRFARKEVKEKKMLRGKGHGFMPFDRGKIASEMKSWVQGRGESKEMEEEEGVGKLLAVLLSSTVAELAEVKSEKKSESSKVRRSVMGKSHRDGTDRRRAEVLRWQQVDDLQGLRQGQMRHMQSCVFYPGRTVGTHLPDFKLDHWLGRAGLVLCLNHWS